MTQNNQNTILEINLKISFRGSIYNFQLFHALKWLVPAVILAAKVIALIRKEVP